MSQTATAGVGLASTVGAAVINRAITGDCYAICSQGFHCDHKDGLCHRNVSVDKNKPAPAAQTQAVAATDPVVPLAATRAATTGESATSSQSPPSSAQAATAESSSSSAQSEAAESPSTPASTPAAAVPSPSTAPRTTNEPEKPVCRPPFRCAIEQGK